MSLAEITDKSILVAAHPDDEVLWFSAILDKVDAVIICFLQCKSKPHLTNGRVKSLEKYPKSNMSCLGLDESEVFNDIHWPNPTTTDFGIEISGPTDAAKKYIDNYYELRTKLQKVLKGYKNVFTHNPWGEYGNEEHIQVYRVIKELQNEGGFNLWFSNYSSNKSFEFMMQNLNTFRSEYVTVPTDKEAAGMVVDLYKMNECWSWYDHYEWCDFETFIQDKDIGRKNKEFGSVFPINIIKVKFPINKNTENTKFFFVKKVVQYVKKKFRKIQKIPYS